MLGVKASLRAANRKHAVADELFESAVDRDLAGTATDADVSMLTDEHLRWRACLAIRRTVVEDIIRDADTADGNWVLVEVVEHAAVRTFRHRVRDIGPKGLAAIRGDIEKRQIAARLVWSEANADATLMNSLKSSAAEALLLRAADHVPASDVAWWATYRQMIADLRGGHDIRPDRWEDGVGPTSQDLRHHWGWLAERWSRRLAL